MSTALLSRHLRIITFATALLLLVAAAAMRFTDEVGWGPVDFLAAAAVVFVALSTIVVARSGLRRPAARAVAIGGTALLAAVVWSELAVGLFD